MTPHQVEPKPLIKNIGKTRNVSNATNLDIQQRTAQKAMMTMMQNLVPAKQKVETKEESDLSDSDESKGELHFQFHEHDEFQFVQVETEFKPQITNLFKQRHGPKLKLNLRQVILLDSQSTIDLLCNKALVTSECAKTYLAHGKYEIRS